MNEVTKIHLGRLAFTIATDAHKELRGYLDAIKAQVKDKDVVEEVEFRMAELLTERGVTEDKVILPKDVEFLKSQLGDPTEFNETGDSQPDQETVETKRLFRDTDNAMLAGVASGLSNYFGIDVLLIRILFVIATITGGWGILLYIALWLLVPQAKTSSERLQMAGKPVTVDSLKEAVARADVAGATRRANSSIASTVNSIFAAVLKVIGLGFIVLGLCMLFALIALTSYAMVHSGSTFGQDIFPVGFREHLLVDLGAAVAALVSVLIIVFGISIFKQKWPIRTWVTGTLVGLILIGLAGSIALGADAAPQVRDRYNSHLHTTTRQLEPFKRLQPVNEVGVDISYRPSNQYSVTLHYFDNPDLSKIKTKVTNGTLEIDSSQFDWHRDCSPLCIPATYNMVIEIKSPDFPMTDYNYRLLPSPPEPMPLPVTKYGL